MQSQLLDYDEVLTHKTCDRGIDLAVRQQRHLMEVVTHHTVHFGIRVEGHQDVRHGPA